VKMSAMSSHWTFASYGVFAVLLAYGLLVAVMVMDLFVGIMHIHHGYEKLKAKASVAQKQWDAHERRDAAATIREQEAYR